MCSNSECPKGSGHAWVSIWAWECVNAVNSSGNNVRKACCHIERIGFSGVMVGWWGGCVRGGGGCRLLRGGEVWIEVWWLTAPA